MKPRTLWRLGSVCVACAALALPAAGQDGDEPDVKASEYGTIDIAVQDTDLGKVLQMLSIQAERNIIASKNVSATVTANLYDVTFYEALDAVLRANGYRYIEDGNFIYVYTQEEYDTIREAQRERVSQTFTLDYLSAADAFEIISPLLSENGAASYRGDVVEGFKPGIDNGGADSYAFSAMLVVNDYQENLDRVASLLGDVDVPPQQILVEATILQTAVDETNAFGVDFTVLNSLDFTDITNPLSAVTSLLNGDDPDTGFQPDDNKAYGITSTPGNTAGPGTLKVGVIRDEVGAFVRVLDEVTDTTVLARPKIMVLNRQRAEVLVGARIGYLSTTATETTTTQTVEFLDTGIQLILRPFISRDGMIRMELAPSVSEASLRTITDANGVLVTIPDELTNELTSNVRIRDGETMVLGGLFRERTSIARRQVPLLGDVPVLGAVFRGQDDGVDRDEIIFLITPSIVHDERLWENGEDLLTFADEVQLGARSGLLPFSRERLTANYNQQARDAFLRGDTAMALHYTNLSLGLNSQQPAMIRMREDITGADEDAYERSLMQRAFHRTSDNMIGNADLMLEHLERSAKAQSSSSPASSSTSPSWDNNSWSNGSAVQPVSSDSMSSMQGDDWSASRNEAYNDYLTDFFGAIGMPEMADASTESLEESSSSSSTAVVEVTGDGFMDE